MKIRTAQSIEEFKSLFNLAEDGKLLETDLDVVENDCELHSRKRRDAEVLCTLAANIEGDCLDLGTSHGRSAFKLATNLRKGSKVFTVNILPEQYDSSGGELVTHLLPKSEIGSYFRERGLGNIQQIYANTATWSVPDEVRDLGMVFVDAAHDTELVRSDSKMAYERIRAGGYLCWHDFAPELRKTFHWIDSVMLGVERFLAELKLEAEIIYLKDSWIGVLRKSPIAQHARKSAKTLVRLAPAPVERGCSEDPGSRDLPDSMKGVRYVLAYPAYSPERAEEERGFCARIRSQFGCEIEAFPLFCSGGWWPFPKLDAAWRAGDPGLMGAYYKLEARLRKGDVLISAGGSMLHPEFVRQLPSFNVYICSDDPESSEVLSRPVASAFDFCFPLNLACHDMYREWGCKNIDWLYHAIRPELCDPTLTEEKILSGQRDLDIVLFCERVFGLSDRAKRLERLSRDFPQALIRGKGWPGGFVSDAEMAQAYRRAKIGWNLHNSIGPVNSRVVTLPAFGVMQICDNKANLGKLFKLDQEIVGFDSIEECIEKTRYYLAHDEERRRIAAAGWKRAMSEFTEARQWHRIVSCIATAHSTKFAPTSPGLPTLISGAEKSEADRSQKADASCSLTSAKRNGNTSRRPRVLLLADRAGWAFDTAAQAIAKRLADEFDFKIEYVGRTPDLNAWPFDLMHVFFWGETYHQRFIQDPCSVIKEITSHRWANEEKYGRLSAQEMVAKYLQDAGGLTVTSKRLEAIFAPFRTVHWTPNGFDPALYFRRPRKEGPLRFGWAGNAEDPCKGLKDILLPAQDQEFKIQVAGGNFSAAQMAEFYNGIDVLCVASTAEGEPLTLLEGMACGCFPVCVDVGIVPELVRHGENGLIVGRTPEAFRAAFRWCSTNADLVRERGEQNASELLLTRTWDHVTAHWRAAFRHALSQKRKTANRASGAMRPPALSESTNSIKAFLDASAMNTTSNGPEETTYTQDTLSRSEVLRAEGELAGARRVATQEPVDAPGSADRLGSLEAIRLEGKQTKSITAPSHSDGGSEAIKRLKAGYFDHIKGINPGELEDVYRSCLFYYRAEVQPLLPPDKNATCLDVGCGFGHLLRYFVEQGYHKCGGVELDERLYHVCSNYIGSKVDFVEQNDGRDFLGAHPSSFDFITLLDVIEHFTLDDALAVCRLIHHALRPGGRVVLRTPNMASLFGVYSRYMDLTHQIGFTEQSLKQLVKLAGFSEADILLPDWDAAHPLSTKLRKSAEFHRELFGLQDRATPKCFEKNLVLWAKK